MAPLFEKRNQFETIYDSSIQLCIAPLGFLPNTYAYGTTVPALSSPPVSLRVVAHLRVTVIVLQTLRTQQRPIYIPLQFGLKLKSRMVSRVDLVRCTSWQHALRPGICSGERMS